MLTSVLPAVFSAKRRINDDWYIDWTNYVEGNYAVNLTAYNPVSESTSAVIRGVVGVPSPKILEM